MALLCSLRRFSCILWAFLYPAPGFEILALHPVSRSSSPGLPCLLHLVCSSWPVWMAVKLAIRVLRRLLDIWGSGGFLSTRFIHPLLYPRCTIVLFVSSQAIICRIPLLFQSTPSYPSFGLSYSIQPEVPVLSQSSLMQTEIAYSKTLHLVSLRSPKLTVPGSLARKASADPPTWKMGPKTTPATPRQATTGT